MQPKNFFDNINDDSYESQEYIEYANEDNLPYSTMKNIDQPSKTCKTVPLTQRNQDDPNQINDENFVELSTYYTTFPQISSSSASKTPEIASPENFTYEFSSFFEKALGVSSKYLEEDAQDIVSNEFVQEKYDSVSETEERPKKKFKGSKYNFTAIIKLYLRYIQAENIPVELTSKDNRYFGLKLIKLYFNNMVEEEISRFLKFFYQLDETHFEKSKFLGKTLSDILKNKPEILVSMMKGVQCITDMSTKVSAEYSEYLYNLRNSQSQCFMKNKRANHIDLEAEFESNGSSDSNFQEVPIMTKKKVQQNIDNEKLSKKSKNSQGPKRERMDNFFN
jgi:hypothetical protein